MSLDTLLVLCLAKEAHEAELLSVSAAAPAEEETGAGSGHGQRPGAREGSLRWP